MARSSLLPYVFVWAPYICIGKMLRISNDFSSEASGPMLLKFHVESPYVGGMKDCKKWSQSIDQRWSPCPYIVKTFKNLLLQNRGCLGAESLHKSLGMGGLPKLLKWWSYMYIDVWPFYSKVKFCFPIHLYAHHTFVWEKCREFQTTSPLKPLGQCCSNFMWSLVRLGERKIAKMVTVH